MPGDKRSRELLLAGTWFLVSLMVTGHLWFFTVKKKKKKGWGKVGAETSLNQDLNVTCKQNCLMQIRVVCFASYFGFLLPLAAVAFCWASTSSFPETVCLGRSPTGAIQAFITKEQRDDSAARLSCEAETLREMLIVTSCPYPKFLQHQTSTAILRPLRTSSQICINWKLQWCIWSEYTNIQKPGILVATRHSPRAWNSWPGQADLEPLSVPFSTRGVSPCLNDKCK